jgi:monoamine oxidase
VKKSEVIVIGAGMAGLAASTALARADVAVTILEARNRIGGRVFTLRDPSSGHPIELGAEFIHGLPNEILQPLKKGKIPVTEVRGDSWCKEGDLLPCSFFGQVEQILDKMDDRAADESFTDFLRKLPASIDDAAKQHALRFVSGFNAADPHLVGVHWLVRSQRAEQQIEGDRAFRATGGYAELLAMLQREMGSTSSRLLTGTVVSEISWSRGRVQIRAQKDGKRFGYEAPRVLVTLPLAVLKASTGSEGAIQFTPDLPKSKLDALDRLEMGRVVRLVLRFRGRFWDEIQPTEGEAKTLANLGFLFSEDPWFPTWWTSMPEKFPALTGWAPFDCADRLSGQSHSQVVNRGLETLSRLFGLDTATLQRNLEDGYCHDWQGDPFSRGAYSYGKVGADGAHEALGSPLENTVFFAGEATDVTGNNGTVHGAMASGFRAASEILQGLG